MPSVSFWAVVAAAAALPGFVALTYRTPSESMRPTLAAGDVALVPGLFHRAPRRGDVVVFRHEAYGRQLIYVKRVVGLPGDRVRYDAGALVINDRPVPRIERPAPDGLPEDLRKARAFDETLDDATHRILELADDSTLDQTDDLVAEPGRYVLLGDNRDNSADSRTSDVGTVAEADILGRVCLVYRPPFGFAYICS